MVNLMGDGKLFLGACLVGGVGLWWFKSTYGRWPWEPATLAQARFNRPTVRRISNPVRKIPTDAQTRAKYEQKMRNEIYQNTMLRLSQAQAKTKERIKAETEANRLAEQAKSAMMNKMRAEGKGGYQVG